MERGSLSLSRTACEGIRIGDDEGAIEVVVRVVKGRVVKLVVRAPKSIRISRFTEQEAA